MFLVPKMRPRFPGGREDRVSMTIREGGLVLRTPRDHYRQRSNYSSAYNEPDTPRLSVLKPRLGLIVGTYNARFTID